MVGQSIQDHELTPLNLPKNFNKLSANDKLKQLEYSLDYLNSEKSAKYTGIAIYSSYFIGAVAIIVSVSQLFFTGHPVRQAASVGILSVILGCMVYFKIAIIREQIYLTDARLSQIREETGLLMKSKR